MATLGSSQHRRSSAVGASIAVYAAVLACAIHPSHAVAQGLTAAAAAAPSVAKPGQYLVHAGDELEVFVWGEDRMQRVVRVQPDGTFSFPLAGTITAVGRAVSDIGYEIRERIAVNYRADPPDVTVSVRNATEMRFFVVGKVRTPGSFTSATPINILQALSMAGGTADFADVKHAVILRQGAQEQIVEPVQLHRLLKGGRALELGKLAQSLPTLSSGDVLVIP